MCPCFVDQEIHHYTLSLRVDQEPHINEIKGAVFRGRTTKKKLVNMKNTSISAKEDVDYILCSCER